MLGLSFEITLGVKLTFSVPLQNGVIGEIVLHASPENPPYSLLAVNQLWPDVLRVRVTCHAHSSVSSLPASLDVFAPLAATPQPTLSIRLIWKTSECLRPSQLSKHNSCRGNYRKIKWRMCNQSQLDINVKNVLFKNTMTLWRIREMLNP